jgi:hypothetical protein
MPDRGHDGTFARIALEGMIERSGMDPSSARLVDAGLAEAALAYPVYGSDVGTAGGTYARARRASQVANWPGVRTPSSSTAV